MINPSASLEVFKAILTTGLACWTAIVIGNNLKNFPGTAGGIARTMNMSLLEAEPKIPTPLYSRKLTSPIWSRVALVVIIVCHVAALAGLALGAAGFIGAVLGMAAPGTGIAAATLGLAAHVAACLLMLGGGLWFVYWLRQEGLQLTHFAILILSVVSALIVNL